MFGRPSLPTVHAPDVAEDALVGQGGDPALHFFEVGELRRALAAVEVEPDAKEALGGETPRDAAVEFGQAVHVGNDDHRRRGRGAGLRDEDVDGVAVALEGSIVAGLRHGC